MYGDMPYIFIRSRRVHMSAVKKQRIDLRLTDDDKSMIEEAAAIY